MSLATPEPDPRPEDLTLNDAPHETAAVLRMHRAGWPGPAIGHFLGYRGPMKLIHEMKIALDDETEAHRRGLKIHDATVPRGTK